MKVDVGRFGLAVHYQNDAAFLDAMGEAERLGFSAIWLSGGQLPDLDAVATVVRATNSITVASGIIGVTRFPAAETAALYRELESEHPGRFLVGLGGAHGPKPFETLNAYLDELEPTVPAERRVLAALGPRMLRLASSRSAGAFPVLVTPEYTAEARAVVGDDTTLAIEQIAVLENDAAKAREAARGLLRFFTTVPAYVTSFRRMGFTDDDITQLSDRLVDSLIAWGDARAIADRLYQQEQAGSDHTVVNLLGEPTALVDQWRRLAETLP